MVNASTWKTLKTNRVTVPCAHAKFMTPVRAGWAMTNSTQFANVNIHSTPDRKASFSYCRDVVRERRLYRRWTHVPHYLFHFTTCLPITHTSIPSFSLLGEHACPLVLHFILMLGYARISTTRGECWNFWNNVLFLGQGLKSKQRRQMCFCYPYVLVCTNVIYSTLSFTSV